MPKELKKNPDLRPVGARALKSAMDTLRPWLFGGKALDLFAGQGRFGLSALEEGAESVVFVEKDPKTARLLEKAIARDKDKAVIVVSDVFSYLEKAKSRAEKFDLVFADPPFRLWESMSFELLEKAATPCLASDAIFLVKHPPRVVLSASIASLTLWKSVRFGESQLTYFEYGEKSKAE